MIFKVPFDETEKVVLGLDYWYKRTENKKKNNDKITFNDFEKYWKRRTG